MFVVFVMVITQLVTNVVILIFLDYHVGYLKNLVVKVVQPTLMMLVIFNVVMMNFRIVLVIVMVIQR